MAAYKDLVGQKITKVTSNPGEPKTGQMWYNSTSGKLRGLSVVEAWASASPMSTAMDQLGGTGTQTAALAGAGGGLSTFEEYNGSGWAAGGSIPTAMELIAQLAGTQTAAICKGGLTPPPGGPTGRYNNEAYTYDGSSWSSIPDSGDARIRGAGSGTQTAYLVAGGAGGPPTFTNRLTSSEEYDGSSWTEGGSMSTAREFLSGFGTQTASIMAGGAVPPSYGNSNASEQYDGTSFSSTPNINTARYGLAGSGTSTSNLIYGGGTGSNSAATESYDGTSWSNKPSMATARIYLTRAGDSSSSGLASAGNSGSAVGTTEEFTASTNTITAAAWASGGDLNTAGRAGAAGSGTQTAAIIAGGGLGTVINNAESYDGSSWTNLPTIGTARGYMAGATNAPYTATLVFGGATGPGGPYVNNSEEYSGSSWAEGNNLNTARGYLAGFGIQTAAVAAGGTAPNPSPPSRQNAAEEYDGTNWTSVTNVPAAANAWGGCGTQTAGLVIGDVPMKGLLYDGTNWTTIPTLNTSGNYNKVFGTYSSAMTAGRNPTPAAGTAVEEWNGTTWFTQASLATGRFNGLGAGTTTAGLVAGAPTATEEFTGETSAANIADFTTS